MGSATAGTGAVQCHSCSYPFLFFLREAIDNYLRESSDLVKKRVENTLKASRIAAANSVRRRKGRSTDGATNTEGVAGEDIFAADSGEKIRAKKHIDPPAGNWEGSGAQADEETDLTAGGDSVTLTFADDSLEGSGGEMTSNADTKGTDDDNLNILMSFFLNNEPVDQMTKDAIKDMLKFRKTFVTSSDRDDEVAPTNPTPDRPTPILTLTTTQVSTPTPTPAPTANPSSVDETPSKDSDHAHKQTTAYLKSAETDKPHNLRPAKRSENDPKPATPVRDAPTDAPEDQDDLLTSASEEHPVAAMPEALPLIASPPKLVHFNPPSVTVRQRVAVVKPTPARPTTSGPELDDFTELVYASGAQRQPEKAEVAPPDTRTTASPPPTSAPTPDPYTE